MTIVIQAVALVLVAGTGAAVAVTRDPLRQTLVAGLYGLLLVALFVAYQAPDVALSAAVVGALALPLLVLLALAKLTGSRE